MPLETVTHISDLNVSNPPGTDAKNQGDDHIRNIKVALRTDLPNITGVVNSSQAQLNLLNSIAALTVLANATNGAAAPTALAAGSDGQVLRRAASLLAFGSIDISNAATVAAIAALTVIANATNASAAPTALAAAADGQVLRRSASALAFGAIDLTNINAVSNPITYAYNTGTQLLNAGTTYADITGHTGIALVTGALYEVETFFEITSTGVGGFRWRLQFTNTPQWYFGQSTAAESGGSINSDRLDNNNSLLTGATSNLGVLGFRVRGRILANAATGGTVKAQAAQNAAVGTSTIQPYGYIKLTRIA